jgi:diguanylate cyclase (GGDEF)-like protein/putative nucleotidyltransferase with HDIG domain
MPGGPRADSWRVMSRRWPAALWEWLVRAGDGTLAAASGPRAMARMLGALYVFGATIGMATMLFPQPPGTNVPAVICVFGAAYLMGALLLVFRDRLLPIQLVPALATATVLITLLMVFSEHRTGSYAMFYVWAALVAGYFLTWPQVAFQAVLVAGCYAVALGQVAPDGAPAQYVMGLGTVVVAGSVVGSLRRGVATLFSRLATSARTDQLTGLLNRRGFDELLEIEVERSIRAKSPLGLLLIDLDDFKSVNDRYGHADGDQALRLLAKSLGDHVRRIDRAARIDGEEFAVLLPDTEAHSAYLLAERLRTRIVDEIPAAPIELSVSIGVVSCPKHATTYQEMLNAGERALLAAKVLGGNRAVMYDPEIVGSLIAGEGRRELRRDENIAAVMVLAETLDMRDSGTAAHSQTVGRLCVSIGRELGLDESLIERLRVAGVLHDIGKIGVQDSILRKPGALREDEYAEMQRHAELGARILAGANLDDISEWVHAHHERPDGNGYPYGLHDEQIPLEAKILAVADSYEAMTSDRVYRLALGHDIAQAELRKYSGLQFDPVVVEALVSALAVEHAQV